MLSLTCKIAIKAVICLALKSKTGEKSGIKEISESINASEHTVGKLLQTLVKSGLVMSSKGPKGGFYITPEQKSQRIIRIIYAIDGQEVFNQCGLGLSSCSSTHPCPMHEDYLVIRNGFQSLCEEKSIAELCGGINEGLAHLIG